jgi:hypothetical protein
MNTGNNIPPIQPKDNSFPKAGPDPKPREIKFILHNGYRARPHLVPVVPRMQQHVVKLRKKKSYARIF